VSSTLIGQLATSMRSDTQLHNLSLLHLFALALVTSPERAACRRAASASMRAQSSGSTSTQRALPVASSALRLRNVSFQVGGSSRALSRTTTTRTVSDTATSLVSTVAMLR
jgi:hypothetical protein